ncbi:YhcB family protein [Arsukibacterium sp.]|uniref:YhcB family protein n=1 Tax=Arsukibacterium sp. TaxID=1977258 RepID=UPI002FDB02A1
MDIMFGLLWAGVGLVVGAGVTRWFSLRQFNQHQLQLALDESQQQLSQYRQEVSAHLETSHQLMSQLHDNYERIARHMQQSKMQLVEQPLQPVKSDLNYLSSDTASHIKQSLHQIDEKRRVYSAVEQQPKDYAGYASGLIKERSDSKTE